MQLLPSSDLATIVKHFLILEADIHGIVDHRLFSDGNSGMAFHYGDPFISNNTRSFIYGQITKFHNIISAGKVRMLVVVFHPYGAHSLLKMPAKELTDSIIPLKDLWGNDADILEDKIQHDHAGRIAHIETFLRQKIKQAPDGLVKSAVSLINSHRGLISMKELSASVDVNERTLERKFLQNIGVSPKHFSNTIRLQYFLKSLKKKSSLTSLAYECGYYDQAHLIREFKKNVGITPNKYIAANPLAVNFIQLSDLYNSR